MQPSEKPVRLKPVVSVHLSLLICTVSMLHNIIFVLYHVIHINFISYQYIINEFSSAVVLPAMPDLSTNVQKIDAAFRATHPAESISARGSELLSRTLYYILCDMSLFT